MPEVNYETLRYLIFHLARLAANQAVNKMDPKNLAIVFGPNLIRDPDLKVSTMVSDMAHHYRILETLIVAVSLRGSLHFEVFVNMRFETCRRIGSSMRTRS